MESLSIIPDLEKKGFRDGAYKVMEHEGQVTIGAMTQGTEKGKPVVMIGFDLGDDGVLVAQTTLTLFLTAADVLKARYGDPR
jgi:hypothetical protein